MEKTVLLTTKTIDCLNDLVTALERLGLEVSVEITTEGLLLKIKDDEDDKDAV
jgi:hypothetical protein